MIHDNEHFEEEDFLEENSHDEEDVMGSDEDLLAAEKDRYVRLYAEFENYRKRSTRERNDVLLYGNENLLRDLMPVVDDFERAMPMILESEDQKTMKGVELIHQKLMDILKHKGLNAIDVKAGDEFDVELHEAVTQIPAPDPSLSGKIVDVIETGYKLHDKVIRFAKVVVGK
ncbi:MAG: nucleotide exchange factor GrpE [Weeksellaceae bacterium]|nr:nucleotide exchange factor GrpE [Weeksellaceae bacterium]